MKTVQEDSKKTLDERAREYFNSLTKPYASEQGLVETAYVIGCMEQQAIDRFNKDGYDDLNRPLYVPPDHGDICWQIGAETFTRKEVADLLHTQRAMISNDLKRCESELSTEAYSILKNPRTPKF